MNEINVQNSHVSLIKGLQARVREIPEEKVQMLYFLAYGIYIFFAIVSMTYVARIFFPKMVVLIDFFCIFLLMLYEADQLLRHGYTWQEWLGLAIAVFFGVLANLHTQGHYSVFYLLMFCVRRIELKKVAKLTFVMDVGILAVSWTLALIGVIPNSTFIGAGYAIGFTYYLIPLDIFYNMLVIWMYLREKRFGIVDTVIILLVNQFFFQYFHGSLFYGLVIIGVAGVWILKGVSRYKAILKKPIQILGLLLFPVSAGISFWASANYLKYPFLLKIPHDMRIRLELGFYALQKYPMTLFGESVWWVGSGLDLDGNAPDASHYNYVDNLFVQNFINYGVIYTILVLAICILVAFMLCEEQKYTLLWIVVLMAAHSLFDDAEDKLYFNVFVLLAGYVMLYFNKRFKNEDSLGAF